MEPEDPRILVVRAQIDAADRLLGGVEKERRLEKLRDDLREALLNYGRFPLRAEQPKP